MRETIPNMPLVRIQWLNPRLEIPKRIPSLALRIRITIVFEIADVPESIASDNPRLCNIKTSKILSWNKEVPFEMPRELGAVWTIRRLDIETFTAGEATPHVPFI